MKARNLYPWLPLVAASLAVAAVTVSRSIGDDPMRFRNLQNRERQS